MEQSKNREVQSQRIPIPLQPASVLVLVAESQYNRKLVADVRQWVVDLQAQCASDRTIAKYARVIASNIELIRATVPQAFAELREALLVGTDAMGLEAERRLEVFRDIEAMRRKPPAELCRPDLLERWAALSQTLVLLQSYDTRFLWPRPARVASPLRAANRALRQEGQRLERLYRGAVEKAIGSTGVRAPKGATIEYTIQPNAAGEVGALWFATVPNSRVPDPG